MKWIGHNPHALGEQEAESKIRASFGGFTGTMQNALNPRMTQGFRGKPGKPVGGGGKGGGGDKPAAGKKTAELSPVRGAEQEIKDKNSNSSGGRNNHRNTRNHYAKPYTNLL